MKKVSESAHQRAVLDWASNYRQLDWLHAIPNGAVLAGDARKRAIQMSNLKAQGLKTGVADLFLPLPVSPYHGLYIEMKTKGGKQSDRQSEFEDFCTLVGYKYVLCYSSIEAIEQIRGYAGI